MLYIPDLLLYALAITVTIGLLVRFARAGTFVEVVALAIDVLFASWIWRDYDITISSWCGLELRKARVPTWRQMAFWTRLLARALNRVQPNHCEGAIAGDIARAKDAIAILSGDEHG